ncbi:TonB-dependent receptor plug domain-containing protein, partial [Rhizorhabdus wittichii]
MKKHSHLGWTKSSVAVAALMLPAIALAQAEQPAEEQYSGDIVVTATRQSESLSKVPLSVSAFSQEKLDSRGVRNFADVIRQTPGVVFQATNNTTNISIRGINSTAG